MENPYTPGANAPPQLRKVSRAGILSLVFCSAAGASLVSFVLMIPLGLRSMLLPEMRGTRISLFESLIYMELGFAALGLLFAVPAAFARGRRLRWHGLIGFALLVLVHSTASLLFG